MTNAERAFCDIISIIDESTGCTKPDGAGVHFWCFWNPSSGPPCYDCASMQRMIVDAVEEAALPASR